MQVCTLVDAPLSVPLREPFVIATARLDETRAALVTAMLRAPDGREQTGLGEAAALPPVTREDQPDLLVEIAHAAKLLRGRSFADLAALGHGLDHTLGHMPGARAGIETAILDAWARLERVPFAKLLGGPGAPGPLESDMTLPITTPKQMAEHAVGYRKAGFTCFKVRVGKDRKRDLESLRALHAAVPDARVRLDANAGFTARDALGLLEAVIKTGVVVECFEQPCAREDWHGMAEVTAQASVPVVADESFRDDADLDRLLAVHGASAVNLKLAKLGGPLRTVELARRAKAEGLKLMAGAMVETRLGLVAMGHVVGAIGGVDWVDLDTAHLLAEDPFIGGWKTQGAKIEFDPSPGLGGIARR